MFLGAKTPHSSKSHYFQYTGPVVYFVHLVLNRAQVPDMALVLAFNELYFRPSAMCVHVCSVGGDIPIDYEDVCGDFVNLKMM
jgi:hypothetical protein